jgi:hypothetical protein
MPSTRTTVTQVSQIGVEAAPGVAVPATKLLQSVGFTPSHQANIDTFGPSGQKYDSITAMNREWTELGVAGQPTYDELPYVFGSVITAPVFTSPGATARQQVFTPKNGQSDSPVTYTVEYGDRGGNAERCAYVLINEVTLGFSRNDGISLDGNARGLAPVYGIYLSTNEVQTVTITGTPAGGNFTLTFQGQTTGNILFSANAAAVQTALEALSNIDPGDVLVTGGPGPGTPYVVEFRGQYGQVNVTQMTAAHTFTGGSSPAIAVTTTTPGAPGTGVPLIPILPGQVDVWIDDTAAGLGTTKLAADFSAQWALSNRYGEKWVLDSSLPSFAGVYERKPTGRLTLEMENNAAGQALVATMRSGASKFIRIQATGSLIESGQNYMLRVDTAGKVAEAPTMGDVEDVSTLQWVFTFVNDTTWGKPFEVTTKNTLSAL